MHPLYDPGALSDDEILNRLNRCYSYMAEQRSLGHDPTVDSIKHTIMALEIEQARRFEDTLDDSLKKAVPDYLKPIELGTIEGEEDEDRPPDSQ